MIQQLKEWFQPFDLDVRKSNNARFTDQKVIPDVLCAVSECVLEFVRTDTSKTFTKTDIWNSAYAQDLITSSFNKPDLTDAKSEYDKFFAQPLKALAYAKVLNEQKDGTTNYYSINNSEILQYISLRERNALDFLYIYLEKVIQDSGLSNAFDTFFEQQDKHSFETLRNTMFDFYKQNTKIKKDYEPSRIFNKIINILAFKKKKKGSVKGALSKTPIYIDEIRYNRINWRDIGKEKGITREEFSKVLLEDSSLQGYFKYNIQKAKKFVRLLHPFSEIHRFEQYLALQAHHIFMESEFPEIADYPENIICITPNQHFYRAHPNNKTSVIDKDYQIICLLSKLDSIEINNKEGKDDYSLSDFIDVLNIGFKTDYFKKTMDYEELKHQIIKFSYHKS